MAFQIDYDDPVPYRGLQLLTLQQSAHKLCQVRRELDEIEKTLVLVSSLSAAQWIREADRHVCDALELIEERRQALIPEDEWLPF